MRFRIGMKVESQDGQDAGSISEVLVNPHSKEIDAVAVSGAGNLGHDMIVNISLIEGVINDKLHLRLNQDQLRELPSTPGEPASGGQEAPPQDIQISHGTHVVAVDGPIGVVDEVRSEARVETVSVIVVRAGMGLDRDVEIPMEFVDTIEGHQVKLSLTKAQVKDLPLPTMNRYIPVDNQQGGNQSTS